MGVITKERTKKPKKPKFLSLPYTPAMIESIKYARTKMIICNCPEIVSFLVQEYVGSNYKLRLAIQPADSK